MPVNETPPLDQIYFYLTEGCNLACRHCWLAPKFDPDGNKYPVLDPYLFQSIIAEAKPLGLTKVKLTGGEPLLHPRFEDLLFLLNQEKIGVTIETNGMLMTPAIAEKIAAVKNPFVSVSIDGIDARTHDGIRGVENAFEKAKRAVRYLAGATVPVQIIMTLMEQNAHQVDGMVAMAEDLGAGSVKFNLLQPTARGEALYRKKAALNIQKLIEIGHHVDHALRPKTKIDLYYDYPPAFRSLSRISKGNGTCGILGILGVISTGHYALCGIGMHIKELVFGSAGKDPLERVWREHPVLMEIRRGLPEKLEGVCRNCLMKYLCLGSCIAQGYYRANRLWAPFWFCEQAEQNGLFPVNRLETIELAIGRR